MHLFSRQELAKYNGIDGAPAYIAYEGKVYDVSNSYFWRGGKHWARHFAGVDCTAALADAPHSDEMLSRVPLIGILTD